MHIGISTLMIQGGRTGVAQYLFALLGALQRQTTEHRFTLFVLEQDLPLFEFLKNGMSVVLVAETHRPPVRNILWHQRCLPALAGRLQLDLLHIPSYRRMLAVRPCTLVATIHDLAPFRVPKKYDWTRMLYGRVVARWLARRQDRIIAVSKNTARDLVSFFGLPRQRIEVVPNGIDHERFRPGPAEQARASMERRYGVDRPFFLYVARLEHPGKNHVRLIEAFNRFKGSTGTDWQLVLGGSDWHGAAAIHAALQASPYRRDIRALGFVAESDLRELYQAAAALVYPSLYEGFGLPPLEAMACGCPVICSSRGSLGEVVGDAAVIVDPEDVDGMAHQLERLAAHPSERARFRAAGLARARAFDWSFTALQTLAVYAQASRKPEFDHKLPACTCISRSTGRASR